jgi:hypothetical protein
MPAYAGHVGFNQIPDYIPRRLHDLQHVTRLGNHVVARAAGSQREDVDSDANVAVDVYGQHW